MALPIAFTRLAQLDLDELIIYIGEANPRAAVTVSSRILARVDLLQDQPELGRKGKLPGTRELVVEGTRYIVVYRIDQIERRISVLRILHGSRQWPESV
jgi:toxin ParE1/3/4